MFCCYYVHAFISFKHMLPNEILLLYTLNLPGDIPYRKLFKTKAISTQILHEHLKSILENEF